MAHRGQWWSRISYCLRLRSCLLPGRHLPGSGRHDQWRESLAPVLQFPWFLQGHSGRQQARHVLRRFSSSKLRLERQEGHGIAVGLRASFLRTAAMFQSLSKSWRDLLRSHPHFITSWTTANLVCGHATTTWNARSQKETRSLETNIFKHDHHYTPINQSNHDCQGNVKVLISTL